MRHGVTAGRLHPDKQRIMDDVLSDSVGRSCFTTKEYRLIELRYFSLDVQVFMDDIQAHLLIAYTVKTFDLDIKDVVCIDCYTFGASFK